MMLACKLHGACTVLVLCVHVACAVVVAFFCNAGDAAGLTEWDINAMVAKLRQGQTHLETTTQVTLAVLALASGVYTYLGVRGLLDGTATVVFFGAVIYSAAVSVGIYAFWSFLFRFLPHVQTAAARFWLYIAMAIGSAMIIAMSSWLNAAALAGSAALEQHMANATETYQQKLDQAHGNALAAQSLLPDIQLASKRFASLAEQERASGALTGTSGSGTVVQLLSQMSRELDRLASEVEASRDSVKRAFDQGGKHLARMRELVSGRGPIDRRSNDFGGEVLKLIGQITALQQTSVAPSVKRTADDLGRNFIAPIADGRDAGLQRRQTEVVGRVEKAVRQQSRALSSAAEDILAREPAEAPRFQPLSTAEAVLLYAKDFLPSWAGAISIDLLPAVLVFILVIVEGAIRRGAGGELDAESMSAADVLRGAALYHEMQARYSRLAVAVDGPAEAGLPDVATPSSVTPPQTGPAPHAAPAHTLATGQAERASAPSQTPSADQVAENIARLDLAQPRRADKQD